MPNEEEPSDDLDDRDDLSALHRTTAPRLDRG